MTDFIGFFSAWSLERKDLQNSGSDPYYLEPNIQYVIYSVINGKRYGFFK